ncbi:hypothetical protein Zmor_010827 [Zophobas morio]|uniref:RRM domain-containing protein n=1 Tax=Zophobas morio TaxID=2755281 RepID=A0AA38MJZ7_9CUCU|nr:hypothetical protein Zmor_010827 [Zophobas morio]
MIIIVFALPVATAFTTYLSITNFVVIHILAGDKFGSDATRGPITVRPGPGSEFIFIQRYVIGRSQLDGLSILSGFAFKTQTPKQPSIRLHCVLKNHRKSPLTDASNLETWANGKMSEAQGSTSGGSQTPSRKKTSKQSSKSFAFIEFINHSDAETACDNLNGTDFLGSKLRVEIARGKARRGGFRGGRGRGGPPFRGGGYGGDRGFRGSRGGRPGGRFDPYGGRRNDGNRSYGGRDFNRRSDGFGRDSYGGRGGGGRRFDNDSRFRSRSPAGAPQRH